MPLTYKGKKIIKERKKTNGTKKGEQEDDA